MSDRSTGHSVAVKGQDAWQQSPSLKEWGELYDSAMKFKQAECWNWMWDTDLFGVQNPESGEVGYCCVMGRGGEHFALGVYLGTEGLETYRKIQRDGNSLSLFDMVGLQKCLTASFEDRRYLSERDFNVIKALSLKFRGHNAWPQFRSYLPGYAPWYLSKDEAKFLTVALLQAVDVALRFKDNPQMLNRLSKNQYLVRVAKKGQYGLEWSDEWMEPSFSEKKNVDIQPVDEHRLNKIKSANLRHSEIWETDLFYFPQAIWEKGQRPYYPRMMFIVDHFSGMVLGYHLAETEKWCDIIEVILKTIENLKIVPEEMWVKREESLITLESITSNLKIKLKKVKSLPMLEIAQESFLGSIAGERF
jgi:hypothetical protein